MGEHKKMNKVFTEDQRNLMIWCLEQMWLDFNPQEEQDAHNIIELVSKLTEVVPAKEVAHVHQKRDLDSL